MAYGYKRKRRYTRRRRPVYRRTRRRPTARRSRSIFAPRTPGAGRIPPSLRLLGDRVRDDPGFADKLMKLVKSTRYGRQLSSRANWWKSLGSEILQFHGDSGPGPRQMEALASMASWMFGQFDWQNDRAREAEYSRDPDGHPYDAFNAIEM